MTLFELINNLKELERQGHGRKKVFARHSASGDANPVGYAFITDLVTECGPFDLAKNEAYVSISIGN